MKYYEALKKGEDLLNKNSIVQYESDAFILFEYAFGIPRQKYILKKLDEVSDDEFNKYEGLLAQRISGKPVQYITGVQNFMGYDFSVNENVLIPRYDTEILVSWILEDNSDEARTVLDVCTGSGCILLSILLERKMFKGIGIDISDGALEVAGGNKVRLEVENGEFIKSDMFTAVNGSFDIIVSNPPYIQSEVVDTLDTEVKDMEPRLALDGGKDGLDFYRIIAENAKKYLNENGLLYLEIGYDQGQAVSDLLKEKGYKNIEVRKDLAGLDRCVKAGI